MKKREGRISIATLVIVSIITIAAMSVEFSIKVRAQAPYYHEKIAAAQTTARAFAYVKKVKDSLLIPVDNINDPNHTGMIGLQFSPLTIERGDLQVKLTATNPNIAAMVVHLLKRVRIQKGDSVGVYVTGSTPALNIATVIALETIGAVPIIVTSVGSAMWGANYPDLTVLDIERILWQADIISSRTRYATIGGHDETGRGFSPEGRARIDSSIARNAIPSLRIHDISGAIDQHIAVYTSGQNIDAFICISEYSSALTGFDQPPGIIRAFHTGTGMGLIPYFSRYGIDVINLTQLHQLTAQYDLPIAPIPLPGIGEGTLYYEYRYSVILAVILLIVLAIVLFIMLRYDVDAFLQRSSK
jgi:poly-gamma-glutamate system protein